MKEIIEFAIKNRTLKKLVLSKSVDKNVLKTVGRLSQIKGELYLALEFFYADGKTFQKNISAENACDELLNLVPQSYKQMNIITTGGDCEVKVSKKGKVTVIDKINRTVSQQAQTSHDRKKNYIIPDGSPVDFLIELGVSDKEGRIFDKKRSKFRQINRFLEIVSDVENEICKSDELYILDLCCGKSYLSFAIYYYFTQIKHMKVTMDCVDLKADVIEFCSNTAKKLNYDGLHFTAGDIRTFEIKRSPDLTVSLHACDIATDIVLAKGIDSNSRVILSTPCCHHEIMHQLKPKGVVMDFIQENSILKQKFADALTDALRCKVLEINGYDVNAMELIDPEETPKNVLIRGVKCENICTEKAGKLKKEYAEVCDFYGIAPYLWEKYAK